MIQPADPSNRPRILQVVTHLALGGAEQMCFTLMRGLRDRFEFGVFAVHGADGGKVGEDFERQLQEMSVPLFTGTKLPIKLGGMIAGGRKLKRAIAKFKPDIVHLHTEIPEATYAAMIAMPFAGAASGVPLVRTIHNAVIWTPWQKMGRWCERHMRNTHAAAVSQAAMNAYATFRRASGAGALPADPIVIYNGVAEDAAGSDAFPPRATSGATTAATVDATGTSSGSAMGGGATRILFAGRLDPQKGADLLPDIMRGVDPVAGRVNELVIFGAGDLEERVKAMREDPPAGWVVRVEGPVADLRRRMRAFDLFIMPSRYEGFGLVAVEALLGGLPVVATRAPGLEEVFPPGYPYLARPDDAASFAETLQFALRSPQQWRVVADAGAQFAREHFSVAVMCQSYAELYGRASI